MDIGASMIGEQVKRLRFERGLSQRDLGKLLGTSCTQVCRIEREQISTSIGMLKRIAEVLNCDLVIEFKHRDKK